MLPRTLADGAEALLPVPGGAVFNTAIALGRLGVPAGFFSGISSDLFGRRLEANLEAAKVDASFCIRLDRPTTLAFVELVDGEARYFFYDEATAGRMLSEVDLPDLPDTIEALHFGAISLVAEPCGSAFEALAAREASQRVISLDPNIRPTLIADPAAHRERIRRLIGRSDIVKVSEEDVAWIEPDMAPDAAIDNWIADGTSIVVLTRGAEGATVSTALDQVSVAAEKAEVVDTIGAGDCFIAGFLAGLQEQALLSKKALRAVEPEALRRSLELAVKVAAIVVSRAGANPPWRNELGELPGASGGAE